MSRIKRVGYIFWTSVADYSPLHVHVFRDGRLVLKWDLERGRPMQGIDHRLIEELQREGKL